MTAADYGTGVCGAPYATGGGGTVLEHRYGAVLLVCLLTGDPVTELGDDATPVSVHFQASAISPVDDLLVAGSTPDGGERRVSIGVRRAPALVASDSASAQLLASYLRIVAGRWEELRAGRWRLCLAVTSPNASVRQLSALTEIARASDDAAQFRTEVARPGRTNQSVRARLPHIDALVTAAQAEVDSGNVRAEELTWRLLSSLRTRELRLEGADQTDRTHAVVALRTVTRDPGVVAADQLFSRLTELANSYAPAAAQVTMPRLRRDLSGTPLRTSPSRGGPHVTMRNAPFAVAADEFMSRRVAGSRVTVDGSAEQPVVVGDVPHEPPAYQPRAGLLAELDTGPETGQAQVVRALTGMRGVGKTHVAAAYARERIADGWRLVAWVNADSDSAVLAGLAAVAAELGIGDPQSDHGKVGEAVRHRLEVDGSRCLLVFDNAADPDALRPFLPAAGAARVLITSTRRSMGRLGAHVGV